MIIDGEKWACEACVRGHRVSNCGHSDRPLQHINKKGRPVSQCAHCRAMRKSRSSHVKCDCGEKTSKCTHLQPTVDGHTETCCCNHGGRCSCAQKKDIQPTLDTVPESDSEGDINMRISASRPKLAARRRRANTIHSDGGLSFDHNGNHKPASKHTRVSSKVGPYQLNRVNSANSTTSLSAASDTMADARQTANQRRVKSEATSPLMSNPGFDMNNAMVPPLDLTNLEPSSYVQPGSNPAYDLFGAQFSPSDDQPLHSAGLDASGDWSRYGFPGDNLGASSFSQPSTNGFGSFPDFGSNSDYLPNLINTTSNSGDVSEVEDFVSCNENDLSGSFMRQTMLGTTATDITAIDYGSFFKTEEPVNPMIGTGSMVEEDPAFWAPGYNNGVMSEGQDPLGFGDLQ